MLQTATNQTSAAEHASYHTHVDGLRAIAILLVLLFHFELAGAEQGFLGVDIFFVISGFLVSGIVFRGTDQRTFNLIEFYRRRLARILPALVAVAFAVLCAGWFILLSLEYLKTAQAIEAALTISANHHFYNTTSYFAFDKYEKIFLHSWSLSVEEQFYLIFPLIALAVAPWRKARTALILALIVMSGVWFLGTNQKDASSAFYYMPMRAWELLSGVLLASIIADGRRLPARGTVIALIGFALMLLPSFIPQVPRIWFSPLLQLTCVVGTLCLLSANLANPNGATARILSAQPLRILGFMSYSLYLIHWPVITLAKYWAIVPLSLMTRIALAVCSIVLAWMSWKWIENPSGQ